MIKKLSCLAKTLDDDIVRDGLCAVGALENSYNKKLVSVVGGIAVQSYLHKDYRRPTSDIDLLVGVPLNNEDFKSFSKPVREYLWDNGYIIENGKTSGAYKLIVSNPKTDDKIVIEFARRNIKNFEKHQKHIERELENSRKKMIESRFATYTVLSPEDLILPKLARSINTAKRREDLEERIYSYNLPFIEQIIQRRLNEINQLREHAMLDLGNPKVAEELRLISDLYDIRILSELVGYNEDYLNMASNDWGALREETPQKHQILSILPKLHLIFK